MSSFKPLRWIPISEPAAQALTAQSATPGYVYPLPIALIPDGPQRMPGVVSYFVSQYGAPQPFGDVSLGGEFSVVRTDGGIGKAYP